jgi:hypothetical protein
MTIQTTIWSPSVCGCKIYYTWDDTLPEDSRTHTAQDNRTIKCSFHTSLSDANSTYSTVLAECTKYVEAKDLIIDNSPSTVYDLTPENKKILKSGIEIVGFYTGTYPNRVLNLSYSGTTLTTNQRNSVQNKLNTIYGTGQVILT